MPKRKEPPVGACPQCFNHVENKDHGSTFLGLFGEPECAACTDHYNNGCPTVVPPKPGFGWW
jgi:hypothetical protein